MVNVQGDEPLLDPRDHGRGGEPRDAHGGVDGTACHAIHDMASMMFNQNVVKVVIDRMGYAMYFSRAPIPYARDAFQNAPTRLPQITGISAYWNLRISCRLSENSNN